MRSPATQKSSGGTRKGRGASAPSARERAQAAIAEARAAAARRQQPPRDPTGRYHELARELANEVGCLVEDVLDEFDERASILEYERENAQDEAERLAWEHTASRFRRQEDLRL